ncbi:cell division protein FtsK [Desulfonema ishimotonii]|uniref:Cell division protein FtsK n=1 Tax=Desulfonema ishimotonii TaxID=45657 RepID=A0A401G1E1_9BACT|nr:DNA translocase FtsK [Desulfonema ishimotonii]GBC63039.1 cell division protein FtsK [Desulfonema ishimotonii]
MRRELLGIFLFFLVLFSLISLLSYTPSDPSLMNAGASSGAIRNLFGLMGAHMAGILVGLFGFGAFWIPILLLQASVHLLNRYPRREILTSMGGGSLLIITTGGFLALWKSHYRIFGSPIPAGGLIGSALSEVMVRYSNYTGGAIVLLLFWLVGFMFTTGTSLSEMGDRLWNAARMAGSYAARKVPVVSKMLCDRARAIPVPRLKAIPNPVKLLPLKSVPKPQADADAILPPEPKPVPKKKSGSPHRKKPVGDQVVLPLPDESGFHLPPVSFLDRPGKRPAALDDSNLKKLSRLLESKLSDFGVQGKVERESPGPVITTFEYKPAPGVKINKIVNLSDDLALALRALSIRIVAPIPGRSVIGIEIPNAQREIVCFRDMAESAPFRNAPSDLTICLGKDIVGKAVIAALDKMPHLLIAGATGTGKSVGLNCMICSFLYKASPDDVKLIMIDPKRIELSVYDGIPHLITPVVTDMKKATNALFWAVSEMERRYELLSELKVRNIVQYNRKVTAHPPKEAAEAGKVYEKLPYIVVIIDELADLMMVASRDVEVSLMRLAQMARAAGIHLILATQRPSVDVLTGIIKANFPTRLTFQVSSKTDSRTIIDTNGAERLLGMGDMLFLPPGTARLQRIHGAYISEEEVANITEFLKRQQCPEYDNTVVEAPEKEKEKLSKEDYDDRYDDAVALVTKTRQASISMVQRHLRIGYNRAARIIEVMEKEGVVGPSDGAKPREVLVPGYDDMP